MAVKLHRCPLIFAKYEGHPCWKVQKALEDEGIEYEVVKESLWPWNRGEMERLSGQKKYPVIEFEDGSVYREESGAMAERIKAGQLFGPKG